MRAYEKSHPWITFGFDLKKLSYNSWLLLGEAESKCEHIAGVPLRPDSAKRMYEIFLSKGIHGTTSIEGNTLSEDEVLQRVQGNLPLPSSREYLGNEVDNILGLCNEIVADLAEGTTFPVLCGNHLDHINKRILTDLPLKESVVPGEKREHSVGVASYRGAPAEDVEYLVDRMCSWLAGPDFQTQEPGPLRFTLAILRAILAHLYIAWIHPYGDGNGRTARIVEFQFLAEAGVPVPAAHLLSDHYNKTRDRYYQVLERTSKGNNHPVEEFILYALEGFVDELREQIDYIRTQQRQVTWENFVHDTFRDQETTARIRQKHLVLDLPPNEWVPVSGLRHLSPRLAEEYAGKGPRTLPRDINQIQQMGLIERNKKAVRANRKLIEAFLPPRATS